MGYVSGPEFRGRGFGVTAARALAARAVASGQVDHVLAHTCPARVRRLVYLCRAASSTPTTRRTPRLEMDPTVRQVGCPKA